MININNIMINITNIINNINNNNININSNINNINNNNVNNIYNNNTFREYLHMPCNVESIYLSSIYMLKVFKVIIISSIIHIYYS